MSPNPLNAYFFTTPNCLVKSATQTRPYEWVSGGITTGFKWVLKPETIVTFETTNLVKVKCKGETGAGNITGKKTVGNVVIKFTGCESFEHLCTTPGRAEGELETKSLEGVIGIDRTALKEGKEIRYAGLDLFPVGKTGVFMEYTCATKPSTTLKGSVIGGVTTDKMFSSGPFTHTQKAGKQKPEGFLGEEKDVLKNNRGEQVGLADNNVQKNEAAIEINAFF
jgi:hypothetical protein